jgi:hypothetical protein
MSAGRRGRACPSSRQNRPCTRRILRSAAVAGVGVPAEPVGLQIARADGAFPHVLPSARCLNRLKGLPHMGREVTAAAGPRIRSRP